MNYTQLTLAQRHQIQALLSAQVSVRQIAQIVAVHRSTVYRELKRNGYVDRRYYPGVAQEMALMRRQKPKKYYRVSRSAAAAIEAFLLLHLSLEQIRYLLKALFQFGISLQTLYNFIHRERRRGGKLYRLMPLLRNAHRRRAPLKRLRDLKQQRPSIHSRCAAANERREIGHFEIDTIHGLKQQSALLTIVCRTSRLTLIRKVPNFQEATIRRALVQALRPYKDQVKSITSDCGFEFGDWRRIQDELQASYHFSDPYASWQRGTNENTNGLIRRIYPKRTDFREVSNKAIAQLENLLNVRPRKCLDFKTPNEVFFNEPSVWHGMDLSHFRL
jgi:transposase, IS30 family